MVNGTWEEYQQRDHFSEEIINSKARDICTHFGPGVYEILTAGFVGGAPQMFSIWLFWPGEHEDFRFYNTEAQARGMQMLHGGDND